MPRNATQRSLQRCHCDGETTPYIVYLNPSFSTPMRFSTGTLTLSNVTKAVPEAHTPVHCICLVSTPAMERSMRRKESPLAPAPPVRTTTV